MKISGSHNMNNLKLNFRQIIDKERVIQFNTKKRSAKPDFSIKKALLIECDRVLQAQHQGVMTDLGLQVTLAKDDREASQLLDEHPYGLILIRDALPTINALLLMRIIQYGRQYVHNKNSVICLACPPEALSEEFKAIFLAHGFNRFLTLPITKFKLDNEITN